MRNNAGFVLVMAAGSIAGAVLGGLLLGAVPSRVIVPLLAALLIFSANKVDSHSQQSTA